TARRVKGAFLIGILLTTVGAVASGVAPAPQGIGSLILLANPLTALQPVAFQLDIAGALKAGLISVLFSFTFVDMFDNIGTLIGVSRRAGLLDEQGQLPRIGKALFADSLGTIFASFTGTSTVTSYIESAAGVSEGGRTGLAAVVVALLFLAAVIFAPLVAMIPAQATAPVLIIVGLLMMGEVVNIRFDDFTEALPAFFTIIMMPLTYSIAQGLAFGFMSYTVIKLITGRHRENNAVTYTLTVLFILHFMLG
ncbi:MAG TPA: NCS2 family permease, partial [Bacillota bacterium]|nr:NCS2 family permease [Bacillota bacterium]